MRLEEVQRGIAVASAYFEDKIGVRPRLLHYAGIGAGGNSAAEDFARWIDDPELTVTDIAPRPETGAATPLGNLLSLAGVVGALAGAA
jgi:type IV pilus assembly protein PilM